MKRKKKQRFRKPPPLYHLTWKFKIFKLTLAFALCALKVGCCVERFVCSSFWFLRYCYCLFCRDIVPHLAKNIHNLHLHFPIYTKLYDCYPVAEFVGYQSASDYPPIAQARFDTDSFKIGIDTLCSVTMSAKRECFQNLQPVADGPFVDGIAGGLKVRGIGTFCFKIEDTKGKLHTIQLPSSAYVPDLPMTLLCPQHWADVSGDDEDGTFAKMTKRGCY
jgi:hypothetical protein